MHEMACGRRSRQYVCAVMPREIITVQVGQCGNQIGCRFWELALREHAAANPHGLYDDALSSFFCNVDERFQPPVNVPVGHGGAPIRSLKARSVVVDMEEGVINNMMKGPLASILDSQLLLYDVSGAGNNWAHGHHGYGPQYQEQLRDRLRRTSEACDSLQGVLMLHSLGGGTGSGLGTYILGMLQDEFPGALRLSVPVLPSEDDHVVTSPYNALLAASCLVEDADCVVPLENSALLGICGRLAASAAAHKPGSSLSGGEAGGAGRAAARSWDGANGLAASLLLHVTSSVRFAGDLNLDLSDITTNLVPFPRMHFLLSSLAPLAAPKDVGRAAAPRALDQVFSDVFAADHQLLVAAPRAHTYLATCLQARGAISLADVQRNVARLQPSLRMAHWNQEGCKLGLCAQPPVGLPYSLMALANNCCMAGVLGTLLTRFHKLYKRRIFLHHYTEYMDAGGFDAAAELVASVQQDYADADGALPPPAAAAAPHGQTCL